MVDIEHSDFEFVSDGSETDASPGIRISNLNLGGKHDRKVLSIRL
jgi:hypothetical protein